MLYDFEDGSTKTDGYDNIITNVPNPSPDAVNSSSYCQKVTNIEAWGRVAEWGLSSTDLSQYGFSIKVYAESLGELTCIVSEGLKYPEKQQAILAKDQWVQLYFDFSDVTSTVANAKILQFGTGMVNTIYMDDIQIVPLSSFPTSSCTGKMDVDYSYGQVAIGGGGFVSGLIAHPTDKNVKFARTDVGGAYKWNPSDCSWKPLNYFISSDDKGLLSIEALAVDPQNSNNIYMLGGCMYFSNQKTAIMYSRDGGETFTTVDVTSLIKAHGNGNGRGNGERLAVDPINSNVLYCGGRAGSPLIVSTDAGENWSAVSSFPSSVYTNTVKWPTWSKNASDDHKTTNNSNGTSAVVIDPSTASGGKSQRIYVGISRTGADNVYISEDGGSSWGAVSGLPTNLMPLRMKLDANGNLLIAYSDKEGPNNCGTTGALYRYNPMAKTATDISPSGGHPIGDVSCSPTSADSLVCTTICTWVSQDWGTGNYVNGDIIFTSTDGGATWRSLQDNFQFDANGCTWIPDHAIHWSCSILMDPFDHNKVSVTSGNGIFTTNNVWCDATGGPTFYFDVNGLEETVALDLVSIPGGDLYSVIGDYTGFRHSDIHSFPPIHKPESHTTGGIAYAAKNPDIMARVAGESYYTENGGTTWSVMSGAKTVYDASYSEVAISADGTTILYLPAGTGSPTYSTNKGANFSASAGCSTAGYVVADPVNSDYFYAGGKNTVYVSNNGGQSFTSTTTNNDTYTRLCVVPGHEGLIYLPQGGSGLTVSTDHGASFSAVSFITRCDAVGVGKGKTSNSYVIYIYGKANGCELGIYRSEDEGSTWQRINDETAQFGGVGNGAFIVGDQNVYGRFYLATVGLGIVYGEPTSSATSTSWSCYVDNTDCNNAGTTKTQYIKLASGWNLISMNVHPADSSIATLFSNLNVEEVKNMENFWKPDQVEYLNELKVLQAGNGYLVRMGKSGTLQITGTPLNYSSYSFNLKTGWNLIGCPYKEITPFSANFDGSNCKVIKDFDGYWKPDGNAYSIENIRPGKAYFMEK